MRGAGCIDSTFKTFIILACKLELIGHFVCYILQIKLTMFGLLDMVLPVMRLLKIPNYKICFFFGKIVMTLGTKL